MYKFYLTCVLCLVPLVATAQSGGTVLENQSVESEILNEEMFHAVYFPPCFNPEITSDFASIILGPARKYPVLYLLHGYSDDQTGWVQFGEVKRIADEAISSGKAAPMIIVMPDAKKTFYVNRADGKYSYEDYFIKELIPFVEKNYPVKAKKEFRAVAGLSMGGYGTFLYALKHPETFAAACPLSSAIQSDDGIKNMPYDRYRKRFEEFFGEVVADGEERITETWKATSIEHLLKQRAEERKERDRREDAWKKLSDEEKKAGEEQRREDLERDRERTVRFYVDCGDDDFLFHENLKIPVWFRDAGMPLEFRIRNGKHNWTYWREALPEVLSFASESFRR